MTFLRVSLAVLALVAFAILGVMIVHPEVFGLVELAAVALFSGAFLAAAADYVSLENETFIGDESWPE